MSARPKFELDLETLRDEQSHGRFAQFLRKPKALETVAGYLLETSRDCIIIEMLNWDSFSWNGKAILWNNTLMDIHCFGESEWPIVAARKLGITHQVNPVSRTEQVQRFLERHLGLGAIVNLEQERAFPDELLLCEILAFFKTGLRVISYDYTLRGREELTIPYNQMTKITYGDRYSIAARTALEAMR